MCVCRRSVQWPLIFEGRIDQGRSHWPVQLWPDQYFTTVIILLTIHNKISLLADLQVWDQNCRFVGVGVAHRWDFPQKPAGGSQIFFPSRGFTDLFFPGGGSQIFFPAGGSQIFFSQQGIPRSFFFPGGGSQIFFPAGGSQIFFPGGGSQIFFCHSWHYCDLKAKPPLLVSHVWHIGTRVTENVAENEQSKNRSHAFLPSPILFLCEQR